MKKIYAPLMFAFSMWFCAEVFAETNSCGDGSELAYYSYDQDCSYCYPNTPFPAPCCGPIIRGRWDFELAALYWRTSTTNKFYALTGSTSGVIETDVFHTVKPHNSWGGRAKLEYVPTNCGLFFSAEYTFFRQKISDSTTNPTVVTFFEPTVRVLKATVIDEYQRAATRVGYNFFNNDCTNFYGFGGIDWIYLKEEDELDATTIVDGTLSLNQKKTYSSAAFILGSGANYYFCNNFGIGGEFNGIAAIGKRKTDFFVELTSGNKVRNSIPDTTIVVPGIDLHLEIFWEIACDCLASRFAIGYEHHHFFNPLLGNRLFFNEEVPSQFQELQDLGFGGLYISAQIAF